ncbi:MAG TPA: HAD family hydrolase [Candidatus Nanopelagicales bacterium]|nr:HAD family hydrolase [Candidatus Nanopelagicales bacterium]
MTYKLLALDVDGTLVRRDGSTHDDDLRAIRRLQAVGVPVTIATGRLYSGTREVARRTGVSGPIACVDGSHIVDAEGGEHHYARTLSGATAAALRGIAERNPAACFLFAQDTIVHDEVGAPFAHYVRTWSPAIEQVERVTSHPYWEHEYGVHALVAVGAESQIRNAEAEIQAELGDAAYVISFPVSRRFEAFGMVVRAAGPTKGTAITWIAEHYRCSPAEVVVVGDWLNDVPMFQTAGRSFAMAQAPDEVKAEATDTLEGHGDMGGGIAEAIRRAFGI